jgi:putative ABC transport system substrate-binding protein
MSRCLTSSKRALLWLILWMVGLILEPAAAFSFQVAVIKSQDLLPYDQAVAGFRSVSRANITEYDMKEDDNTGAGIIEQIHQLKPDAVLAVGVKAAVLAKKQISDIPLVYCVVIDPEKYGLEEGNITGILLEVPINSQFKVFKAAVPTLKRIGVLYDPAKTAGLIRKAQKEADRLGLELVAVEVRSLKEVSARIRSLLPQVQGLWMVPDSTVITADSFRLILLATYEKNIPFMAFSESFVKTGALLSLSPDYFQIGKQASKLVDRVIERGIQNRGKAISPETARLTINVKTAKILGFEIPTEVLQTADEIIR